MNPQVPGNPPARPAGIGRDDRSYAAAQAFLLGAKTFWTKRIFPELKREYVERAGHAARAGEPVRGAADVARLMHSSPLHQYFAWLERHLQRFKYSGRYGLHHWHARDRDQLGSALESLGVWPGMLQLDPQMTMPAYYTDVDIHQHPGGVWSDPLAGLVYERGARSTTPLAGRHWSLHDGLTEEAITYAGEPARVLDMGCGFGKSTRPFYERLPGARIEAIDLAAPCLRVAARDAAESGAQNVRFRQASAMDTGYADGQFDLVTSTMLLHELPPEEVERTLGESVRVLKPGGKMVHLDFLPQVQPGADAFAEFVHYGHGERNNEPFMEPLAGMDLKATLERLGCRNIRIRPFAEAEGALDPAYPNWRFPWTLIEAEKA